MIEFDLDLYSLKSVLQAIKDYRELADIEYQVSSDSINCKFLDTKYERETTIREFCNYALELSVTSGGDER